jgi:GNAT superfamily N-acetyltransferase
MAAQWEKSLLIGSTTDRVPGGGAFAERIGAEAGLQAHTNRLVLADVDRDMVQRWVDEGPQRAPGYTLTGFDGRCPDDLVADVVDVLHVMNDAPRDKLQLEDEKLTVEQFRAQEQMGLATGLEPWWLFARHDETGRLAGLSDVAWRADRPDTVYQGNTGVRPEHRGHALGKWLKAAMLQRIFAERPDAVDIRTGNADSNDAMLGINHALGFAPYIAETAWQVSLDQVRAYVSPG